MTTTSPAFTADDVAALAELVRPHLSADWNLECAVALAESVERDTFERRISKTWELAHILGSTYDEFRTEGRGMSILDTIREQIANHLLTHVGGDESQPWQAGHNYAMQEAARLVRGGEGANTVALDIEPFRDLVYDVVHEAIQQATSTKARSYMSEEDVVQAASGAVEELLGGTR